MKYNIFKIALFTFTLMLFVFGLVKYTNTYNNNLIGLESNAIRIHNGYGYQITSQEKVLIRQEYIPALPGRKVFANEKDAKSVANLVIHKLLNKQSPVVYIKELDSLRIVTLN